jgi:hypothetical protein
MDGKQRQLPMPTAQSQLSQTSSFIHHKKEKTLSLFK